MSPAPNLILRSASEADTQVIRELLARSALPISDLATARPQFVVASIAGHIVGVGALEHFGAAALLRSVAIEPQWRGSGIGRLIVAELERRARAVGIDELILLTLTACEFFQHLGYGAKERAQVPPAVLDSAEFRSLCPASAICMSRHLSPE